jgi:ubiquinone/menaquinone biosynthesis C-methylase UbiE
VHLGLPAGVVEPGLRVADIGAGSGYYTVRLARRLGPTGRVFAEDVVPEYLERLARRIANEGLADRVTIVRGDPHDPRLPPGSVDLALLVHMYHEVQQPYGLLWNLRPALRPGARVAIIAEQVHHALGFARPVARLLVMPDIGDDPRDRPAGCRKRAGWSPWRRQPFGIIRSEGAAGYQECAKHQHEVGRRS